MEIPQNLRYTKDHEWIEASGDGPKKVGITYFAQDALGDVVFVEIKPVGTQLETQAIFGEVESTKSVSELFAPVAGTITAVNSRLDSEPELLNSDPYGEGWMCEIDPQDSANSVELMDPAEYGQLVAETE